VGGRRYLGERLAQLADHAGQAGAAEVDQSVLGRQFRAGKKGGAAVGKTKRGKGTKVMLVTDGEGLPIGLELASARHHEMKLAVPTLETVRVPRTGRGRPKQRSEELIADKAYDSKHFRGWLRRRGIKLTIPSYERCPRKSAKRGRPVKAGPGYAERWKVERTFAWLGSFRRLLTRHERYLHTFRAFFLIAFVLVLLRRF
jgi:transposase